MSSRHLAIKYLFDVETLLPDLNIFGRVCAALLLHCAIRLLNADDTTRVGSPAHLQQCKEPDLPAKIQAALPLI